MTRISPFPFRVVGFDLDGTLLDTSGDLAAAVNHALASIDRPVLTVEEVKPMIGGGARHMLAQGMAKTGGCDEATLDVLHQRLLAFYEANISVHTRPFPGALAAMDALDARGVKLGIMTNKIERFARMVLGDLGLLDRFAAVIGGDTVGVPKPDPAPIRAMVERCGGAALQSNTLRGSRGGGSAAFVGDSIYDVRAAKAAGLPVVACSFGFLTGPVEDLGADAVIDHYDELVGALERF